MKYLKALGCTIATVLLAVGIVFMLLVWVDWAMSLPEPWDIALSPLGAIACGVLVHAFMYFLKEDKS
jgi:uncharacterized membrane-anchored protein